MGNRPASAGSISGERQRSTWDAILTSPLGAREIVVAKTAGSLYALRYLIAAACLAWTAALLADGMTVSQYVSGLALLFAAGAFMAALGVAVSTGITNATRGMAVTIGLWMGAAIASAVLAWLLAVAGLLLVGLLVVTIVLATGGNSSSFSPGNFDWAWGRRTSSCAWGCTWPGPWPWCCGSRHGSMRWQAGREARTWKNWR